jgi:hypothetical protein
VHLHDYYFAARESPEYGHMLLDRMIEQTLDAYTHVPGVQEALEIGARVLLRDDAGEGEALRQRLGAEVLYSRDSARRFFGVRFVLHGNVFHYGLTTGAQPALDGDNNWVESLCDGIELHRPAVLVTGPASRIARLVPLFNKVETRLQAARTKVQTAEVPYGMDLNDPGGRAQWQALANAAEYDYRATVTRLLTGVVFELKNNRYPRSDLALPPGYTKRGGDGPDRNDVFPDPEPAAQQVVRRFIEMAAGDYTEMEIAQELGALGLTTRHPGLRKKLGPLRAHQVGDPVRLVRTLFQSLPTYLDGRHTFKHEMPLANVDSFHGYVVHRVDTADNGYIQQELDFGLPPGGWHDRGLIESAIATRLLTDEDERQLPTRRDKVKPLAGMIRFTLDGFEYLLVAKDTESYELRRRPSGGSRGTFHGTEGQLVGRFSARKLHKAVASILRQLEDGVAVAMPCPATPAVDGSTTQELTAALGAALKRVEGARREAIAAPDPETAAAYRKLGEQAADEATELQRELTLATLASRPRPTAALDGTRLAALIKVLDELPGAVDVAVRSMLRGCVRKARILDAEPGRPLAVLEMVLAVVTDAGVVTTEPLRAYVPNRATGGLPGTDTRHDAFERRNTEIMQMLLLESAPEDERRALWDAEDFDGRSFRRRMLDVLAPVTGAEVASALIDCPILDVRRAALQPFLRHDLPLSPDFSPALEREIQAVYRKDRFSWTNGWCPGGMARERRVLEFVHRYGDTADDGIPQNEVKQVLGLDDSAFGRLLHSGALPYGRKAPSAAPWFARLESFQVHNERGRLETRLRIRQCPHCGQRSLTQPLRVPEVAGYLLCTNEACHRSLLSKERYPDDFFLPWDGSQSEVRRRDDLGAAEKRAWWTERGRVIVGTTLCEVLVPSRFAPRRPGMSRPGSDGGSQST